MHDYWDPSHKGIVGNKVGDKMEQNVIRLLIETAQEEEMSIKTLYNEIA